MTIFSGLASAHCSLSCKYGSGHWDCKFDPGCKFGKFDPNPNRDTACTKFASLVISGSMVSSVIMKLCNHTSSLDSADVINETHWLQVKKIPQSSIDLADYSAVCAS